MQSQQQQWLRMMAAGAWVCIRLCDNRLMTTSEPPSPALTVLCIPVVCALLYLCIGICVWVAWCFKEDNFPFLWPIKFVRVVASIFFGTFYIASLNIFLTTAECVPYGSHWVHHIWHDGARDSRSFLGGKRQPGDRGRVLDARAHHSCAWLVSAAVRQGLPRPNNVPLCTHASQTALRCRC